MDSNQGNFFQRLASIPARLRSRLVVNLLVWLVPLVLIPVIIMGVIAFSQSRDLLLRQVTTQIRLYENKQASNLQEWVLAKLARFDNLNRNNDFRNAAVLMVESDAGSETFADSSIVMLNILDELSAEGFIYFNHFLFTDQNGDVLATSLGKWENFTLNESQLFSEQIADMNLHTFVAHSPYPLYAEEDGTPIAGAEAYTITAMPYFDESETLLGYLIGISDPFELEEVLSQDNDARKSVV